MKNYHPAMPHGPIKEVLPDLFFVMGTMKNEFFGSMWQFSRNMTVVRENGNLTLINTVRLGEEGLKELESLGKVTHVVRIGDMHGVDDPFYVDRYGAEFWAMPGMRVQEGLKVDHELVEGGPLPLKDASLFVFRTSKRPESIIRLNREGGIMIACDSLQNWIEPDEFFDESTIPTMEEIGFFKSGNLGLAWMQECQPQAEDFIRLKEIPFEHALCGHGYPFIGEATKTYHETFNRFFNI